MDVCRAQRWFLRMILSSRLRRRLKQLEPCSETALCESPLSGRCLPACCPDKIASPVSAFRTQIDDVIGRLDDVEIVLDDDHLLLRSTRWFSTSRSFGYRRNGDGGRFIEEVKRSPRVPFCSTPGEFHPLASPPESVTADCREGYIPDPRRSGLELAPDGRHVLEKAVSLGHGHAQDLCNVVTFVPDSQRVPVEPKPLAGVARHVHIREKCISILMMPSPLQASHRPPFTLKLNLPGL